MSTHSNENIEYVDNILKHMGITEYKFCRENDCYICDRYGNVYSICTRQLSKSGRIIEKYRVSKLKGSVDKDGYLTYRITVNGIKKHLKGHRMILNAWDKEHPDLMVNHKDGNKKNNGLDNLEWCTALENVQHAIRTGLINPHFAKGRLKRIKSTDWVTIYILNKHCGFSLSELGRMNHCTHETINRVIEKVGRVLQQEVEYG